jgi:hypothetical protein
MTTTTIISRGEIQTTPGADLSNSLNIITDYVPGAWLLRSVPCAADTRLQLPTASIPNTTLPAMWGPNRSKDIDYLEAQRGSSDWGPPMASSMWFMYGFRAQ